MILETPAFMRGEYVIRQTASKYLKICEELKIVQCVKIGRNHYYVNEKLYEIFIKGVY